MSCLGMISPTGSGVPANTAAVSSRPGTKASSITSSSCWKARVTASASAAGDSMIDKPTVDPCFDGFTTTFAPSAANVSAA